MIQSYQDKPIPIARHKRNTLSSVQAYIRKRPMSEREINAKEFDVVSCGPNHIAVHDCRMHPSMRRNLSFVESFQFDYPGTKVFDELASTIDIYLEAVKPLVRHILQGKSGTMICFGQTGSGKTFTMSGLVRCISTDLENYMKHLHGKIEFHVSCIEIIGEACYDLLNDHREVFVRETRDGEAIVCGEKHYSMSTASEFYDVFEYAADLRETHATMINSNSSRSHYICRLVLQNTATGDIYSQLTLCDLAGSERNADSFHHTTERIKETAQINSSLMALKEVIRCASLRKKGQSNIHVPYRNSKLTRILKSCFDAEDEQNSSLTIVIATVSPISCDTEHTISTLQYSYRMMGDQSEVFGVKMVAEDVLSKSLNSSRLKSNGLGRKHLLGLNQFMADSSKKLAKNFPSAMDGKALARLPDSRLVQILGRHNLAEELRKQIVLYTQKYNHQKKEEVQKLRSLR